MRKAKVTLHDETIKEFVIQEEPDTLDVRLSVMNRVREIHERSSGKKTVRRKTGAVVLIASLIIVLASLTGLAASRYVQILNPNGEVIVETKEIREDAFTSHAKTYHEMSSAYKEHVLGMLKPGELVAYYVHDDTLNAYDTGNKVQTVYKPLEHSSYEAFEKQLEMTNGPLFLKPQYLPEGYSFESGNVFPSVMEGEGSLENLKRLEPEFIHMAETSTSESKLFIKPLSWNTAGSANVRYAHGEDTININAYVRKRHPSSVVSMHPEGVLVEKLTVSGQEMVYMEAEAAETHYKHKLDWLDEEAEVFYSIYDNQSSTLSKSEFVRIVESMLK
ncbi:DUF4367 domain-containing protein [Paenibacillus woosongensis]|uniref:DUF4367 domain-containing protein n=1 Tax=Paenibacillus woosongensis TaxID=307580 RepID=A0A7X2YY16_9BACL|nr:DUF4367 domain-containing protein [Paenibacillus woosongensis]MUG43598.1 DUF4367 domain-containing protein [Paenibacillus woosongensis]